jgi:hypothetical protein
MRVGKLQQLVMLDERQGSKRLHQSTPDRAPEDVLARPPCKGVKGKETQPEADQRSAARRRRQGSTRLAIDDLASDL